MTAAVATRLERASAARVTLLAAPGGSGKTRAIGRYVRSRTLAHTHFVARPGHTDLIRFVRGLVDAMQGEIPALTVGFASAAAAARRSNREAHVLAEWFTTQLGPQERLFAVDDLHTVATSDDVRAFIIHAIELSPPGVRWILGMRDADDWPVANWLAASLTDVPLDAHAFGVADTSAGEDPFDLRVAADVVAWRAGLDPIASATAQALALLPDLSAGLVAALPRGSAVLAVLDTLLPYGRSGGRLRHEVAVALVGTAPSAAALPVAFSLARDALREHGSSAMLLQFVTAMTASDDIVAALDRDGFELIDEHRADLVDDAVEALPLARRRACVLALVLEGTRETELGRHDVAESWYVQAVHLAPDPLTKARVELALGGDLLRRSRPDALEMLEGVVAVAAPPAFHALALAGLAAAYAAAGRSERTRECLTAALTGIEAVANVALRARVYRQTAYVLLSSGDMVGAREQADRALALAEAHGLDEIVAPALSVLLVVASTYADDADATLDLLRRLEGCARRLDNAFLLRYARLGLLEAYGERAAWQEVSRIEVALGAQELENDARHADETLLRIRALRGASAGDFAGAQALLAAASERHGVADLRAFRCSEIAFYAAAAGDRQGAARAIAEAREIIGTRPADANALLVRIELQTVLAIALLGQIAIARRRLDAVAAVADRFPRLRALRHTVACMLAFAAGTADTGEMLESLERLHDCGHGGVASVLGALPLASVLGLAS